MSPIRPLLLATTLPLTLVACGGDDGGTVVPEGEHYQYVASKAYIPTNATQAREYGLDLDGNSSVDNQLGMVLGSLAGYGFDVQTSLDEAVAEGSIILLADLQAKDFTNASAAGFKVLLGDTPMPQPCADPANPTPATCGKHLMGTGTFTIAASSPTNALVAGPIINGTFNGGPGDISLEIAFGGTSLQFDLIGARVKASGMTADAISSVIVGGAVTESDLDTKIVPAMQAQIVSIVAGSCTDLANPGGGCGCTADSAGETVLTLFDTAPKDCAVSLDELKNNDLINSVLAPDIMIDGMAALSLGLKVEAKKATFPAQ